ncbi:MAG: biotin--[acetyl-CoA-carboxylase] ligase [Bacteroidales bacterium]|nr:biotin--[acetyl-CoA-carboxylase] ligase [Bacteroidales bacterium]
MANYKNILNVEEVSSTNVYLCSLLNAETPPNILVVSAEFQTAGKGQHGNVWHSERGKNLLCSHAVFPEKLPVNEQFILSQIVALALRKTMQSYDIEAHIKWANDIYVGDKKIAGILIETHILGNFISNAVVGIGLNINEIEFPSWIPNPISMAQCSGVLFNKHEVLEQYLQYFEEYFARIAHKKELHEEYLSALYKYRTPAKFSDTSGEFRGSIVGVESDGKLRIQHENGEIRRYYFKEVRFVMC